MAFETETKAVILQRMLDATDPSIDKRQGSVTFDMLAPAASEIAQAKIELDNVLAWGFADTSYGPYLDLRCGERGVTRKAAVKSTGQVTLSGADGTAIPVGTEVSTGGNTPILFVTAAAGTIASGSVTVAAEAKVGGASGNVGPGAIKLVLGALAGVVTVTNAAAFNGGADTESDADLLARYLETVRRPATSGNANQYRQWALEIAGISDARVFPIWNGNGTVKVVLLDADKRAPVTAKVTEVSDYIESVRPVGATVTVEGAAEVAINVSGTYTLKAGATLADAQAQILAGLTDYLKTLAFVDPVVRYTQIANVVLNADAVVDYSGLTVNGGTANITVADGSVAVPGTVT
ncbi:baseplate J/gp47 family protein [Paenibacillus naphthalenovorans]|uniref:baseplate J/gp47 family protein n=1 Tax=Paenibacillus naphthalenovorans TaxID=162209 RepID=UPI003D2772CF